MKAADESFCIERESLEKGQLSADRSQAADEAFCTGERALKKRKLSGERLEGS